MKNAFRFDPGHRRRQRVSPPPNLHKPACHWISPKTISITDTSAACGIVPVEVVYEDSHGQRHVATYTVLGNGCGGD
ncbi:DUF2790 domain-containing protein [Pseudomonas moraviensis]|uniref:DUF2790 domain-containing protein n=1 Tax=Pseudomonas moraviensis TaxID=321662 RepID=UPI00215FC623|nr:DUF2790 domain-containing protein [Pseudomonas moraviensis]UVL48748.1 DUF2790 domain-containing protein [Pseudomonas moraviensis]